MIQIGSDLGWRLEGQGPNSRVRVKGKGRFRGQWFRRVGMAAMAWSPGPHSSFRGAPLSED